MRELAGLLNEMRASGVILDYALFGAVAQMAARHGLDKAWGRFDSRFLHD